MSQRTRLPLISLIVTAAAWAWHNRFFQDDAYISLIYARNWIEGHGLVFNPGVRVEGYTNFLWTVLMALPLRLGWDPIGFSYGIGLGCFAVTLLLCYRLARRLSGRDGTGLYAVALLGTNYTFSAYATGGLETQLQTTLVTAVLAWTFAGPAREDWTSGACACWSAGAALAVLTRLDSAVILLAPGLLVLHAAWRRRGASVAALLGTFALLVGPWLVWKWHYYGALVPNTFHAKVVGLPLLRGAWYVALFFLLYLLFIPLLFDVAALWRVGRDLWARRISEHGWSGPTPPRQPGRLRSLDAPALPNDAPQMRRIAQPVLLAHLPVGLWIVYMIAVGGDFMEFRFLVPVLPVTMAIFAVAMGASRLRYAVLTALVVASCLHAWTFDASPWKRGLASVPELQGYVAGERSWCRIGAMLNREFRETPDIRIAVTPAGALPYYARLPVLDMLGLNEPYVARHGAYLSDRPGHRRIATIAYLRAQDVNLVIGHPTLVRRNAQPAAYSTRGAFVKEMFGFRAMPDPESLPACARMIEIPFSRDESLLAIYLMPHPGIEDKIVSHGWRLAPLVNDLDNRNHNLDRNHNPS